MKTCDASMPFPQGFRPGRARRLQQGAMLLEALIAVVVFSIGVLALIGMQSVAIREVTEAKARSDASYLADKVLGDLSTLNLADAATGGSTLLTDFSGDYTEATAPVGADNAIYGAWQNIITRTLPNGALTIAIDSSADSLSDAGGLIRATTITVSWNVAGGDVRTFSQTARLVD